MSGVLLDILIVLVAAKAAAELAERFKLPAVVGEIVAGIVVGPSVLKLVEGGEVLHTLAELGVILLLFQVGLEMDIGELGAVGRSALTVAVLGIVAPMAMGVIVMGAFGESGNVAIFVGAALTATSVGITARVFGDLRALATVEARTVLGAAVADDVLGLVILTVVVRLVADGGVSPATVVGVIAAALAFLIVTAAAGIRFGPKLFGVVHRASRSPGTMVAVALAFTLALAELATVAKLAPIIGAFVAGLALARSDQAERIHRELTPVGHLFIPVFFLQIGIDADLAEMTRPSVLAVAGALLVVAVLGKLVSSFVAPGDKFLVGVGMLPRGEVGLIFAGIGLREGVLGEDLYGALLLVVLATTLMTPPILGWRIRQSARKRSIEPARLRPAGGWLSVDTSGLVELAAEPARADSVHVALDAALLLTRGRPGPSLLDWFGSLPPDEAVVWDAHATRQLLNLLRDGNARSWRFLDVTGVLDRALPELGDALRRRRDDRSELDPMRVLRWSLVDQVHELSADATTVDQYARLEHPEWLTLAAISLEVDTADSARLVQRLDLGHEAEQQIALLVGESGLLKGAVRRADGLDEQRVMELAAHLKAPERARALYLLTIALNDLKPWEREALDELHGRVQGALVHSDLHGDHLRRALELVDSPLAADRLLHTPRAYVLRQDPVVLARQVGLVQTLPGRDEVRVSVVPEGDLWRVDVGARDRAGLLATVSGALTVSGLDIRDADAVTWGDGAVIETFIVRARRTPSVDELRQVITSWLKTSLRAAPVPNALVSFDNEASPWSTLCTVEAVDQPGLLSSLASAFATCRVDVHAARVSTEDGMVCDRFELTDRRGLKLDRETQEKVATTIREGTRGRRGGRVAKTPVAPA